MLLPSKNGQARKMAAEGHSSAVEDPLLREKAGGNYGAANVYGSASSSAGA